MGGVPLLLEASNGSDQNQDCFHPPSARLFEWSPGQKVMLGKGQELSTQCSRSLIHCMVPLNMGLCIAYHRGYIYNIEIQHIEHTYQVLTQVHDASQSCPMPIHI